MKLILRNNLSFFILITILSGCTGKPGGNISETGTLPSIDPDYSGVTIPSNIAPINFKITEDGHTVFCKVFGYSKTIIETGSKKGIISIPEGKWKKFLEENKGSEFQYRDLYIKMKKNGWSKCKTITNRISHRNRLTHI